MVEFGCCSVACERESMEWLIGWVEWGGERGQILEEIQKEQKSKAKCWFQLGLMKTDHWVVAEYVHIIRNKYIHWLSSQGVGKRYFSGTIKEGELRVFVHLVKGFFNITWPTMFMTKGLRNSGGVWVGLTSIAKCKLVGRCVWLALTVVRSEAAAASDFGIWVWTELEIFRMLERSVTLLESPWTINALTFSCFAYYKGFAKSINWKCFLFSFLRYIQVMDFSQKTKNLPNVW